MTAVDPVSRSIGVRTATREDAESVLALMPRLADFDVPKSRVAAHLWMHDAAMFRRWLDGSAEHCFVLVAETDDSRFAGFAMTSLKPELLSQEPSSHLEAIAVAPGFERQGVGKRLLAAAQEEARRRGATSMSLHVFAVNERARALYEQAGFSGELMRYIKTLDD